jgi:hypothetical protein
MDAIDRRGALRSLLCGVVAAGLGAGLVANPVEAMPLAMQKDPGKKSGDFKQEVQTMATRPRPRPPHHRHWRRHRRPRRVCYWRRGRRVCVWR